MEAKKTYRADLEGKRVIFLEIGLIVSLALVLLSLQWKTHEKEIKMLGTYQREAGIEEIIPITQQQKELPPPPVQQATSLKIVMNDQKADENIKIDVEATEQTAVEAYIPTKEIIHVEEEVVEEETIFIVVELAPSFPGGTAALKQYLSENLVYPTLAREANIQGTVYLQFIVGKSGEIRDVTILRGIGGGCDEEAVRVVQSMPRWNPGKQRGVPVIVRFNLPVRFILY
ncbi:MAG TPA: energy transducer TonB [Bacteroidales bacterium]|nr:energy transducer TonB [Bacteroidales bacterium]